MERKTIIRQLINGDSIFDDYDKSLSWVRIEDGMLLEAAIGSGGSLSPAILEQITQNTQSIKSNEATINQVDSELQELKTNYDNHIEDFKTLQQDESELGDQVQTIQGELNVLVRKDTTLNNLCNIENCAWSKDIVSQIESNARAIKTINDTITGGTNQNTESGDILYEETREITIDKSNITQTLMGSFYYYTYNYDISQWDNSIYTLTTISLKNIFIEDVNGRQVNVNDVIQKALNSITFDDNKLYGVILTPTLFNYSTGKVKAVLSCVYKKMIN